MPISSKIDLASERRMASIIQGLEGLEMTYVKQAPLAMAGLTERLKAAVKRQFNRGLKHPDRSTGATLKTMKSRNAGLYGEVTLGGAAVFKEFGTRDHDLPKVDGRTYHWEEGGQDFYSKGHHVRGVEADDFAGRALDEVDADTILADLFGQAFMSALSDVRLDEVT